MLLNNSATTPLLHTSRRFNVSWVEDGQILAGYDVEMYLVVKDGPRIQRQVGKEGCSSRRGTWKVDVPIVPG